MQYELKTSIHTLFSWKCRHENVYKVRDAEDHETSVHWPYSLYSLVYIPQILTDNDQLVVKYVNVPRHMRSLSTLLSPNFENRVFNRSLITIIVPQLCDFKTGLWHHYGNKLAESRMVPPAGNNFSLVQIIWMTKRKCTLFWPPGHWQCLYHRLSSMPLWSQITAWCIRVRGAGQLLPPGTKFSWLVISFHAPILFDVRKKMRTNQPSLCVVKYIY
jgi:hypothetical protein